jgi:hypothetical protein
VASGSVLTITRSWKSRSATWSAAASYCASLTSLGEGDRQRREEPLLRRIRAARRRVPVGRADHLWTKVYVNDAPRAVAVAVDAAGIAGEVLNVGAIKTWSTRRWFEAIAAAAAVDVEFVRVADAVVPADLPPRAQLRVLFLNRDDDEAIRAADDVPAPAAARLMAGTHDPVPVVVDGVLLVPRHLDDIGAVRRPAFAAPSS